MKQSRRQELKTNELSILLQQLYDAANRHARYLWGGLAVVLIVLTVGMVVQRNRRSGAEEAWREYYAIAESKLAEKPELLDQVRTLAASKGDHAEIGPAVLFMQARLLYESALSMNKEADTSKRIERLQEARGVLDRLISGFSRQPDVVARAQLLLASVQESLFVEGQGDKETIRGLYQKLLTAGDGVYRKQVEERISTLDDRLQKIDIVTPPPATAPAVTGVPTDAPTPTPNTLPASINLVDPDRSPANEPTTKPSGQP